MRQIIIHRITPNSIGEALGLVPGDVVLAVNGKTDLEDMLDYQFEVNGSELVELTVQHQDGSPEIYEIEKDPEDDLGLTFTSPIFTPIKTCNNACPFCFIDQQPEGLRSSLYVKDDDYRLSYFNNTYITLTNLTPHDRERIARLRPGPLYVSVHSTVPEKRQILLKNKKAGTILEELRWLKSLEVPFHCQIVVCPGINDDESLTQTLKDLASLKPEALSVAVVPVGLTQHRENLPELNPVDNTSAKQVIQQVESFTQATQNQDFIFLSDEFYFKAGLPLPQYETYGDFPQLDDGVGTVRMLLEDFYALEETLPQGVSPSRNYLILTGQYAAMAISPIITRLNEIEGLYLDVVSVESQFWGMPVAVAGVITGQDILAALEHTDLNGYHSAIIPAIMLKHDSETFLDGLTVSELSEKLNLPFQVLQDPYSAEEFLSHLFESNIKANMQDTMAPSNRPLSRQGRL